MTTILLFGQRSFGAAVAAALADRGHTLRAVVSPANHERTGLPDSLHRWADEAGVPWVDSATYSHLRMPRADLAMAAHSHTFIGRKTRALAREAVGYHPSLLPLHRGRDAIRWTIRDRDRVTGGTVYHLTDNIDGGPIAAQRHALVPRGATASDLWREVLFPLGVDLLCSVADQWQREGSIDYVPQDESLATWEPSWERAPLHRPEVPELGGVPGGPR